MLFLVESFHSFRNGQPLSDSTVNWDLEYKKIASPSNCSDMDVSNMHTPRSRIFVSQRKKLSDSFHQCDDDDDMMGVRRIEDVTDAGYQTGVGTMCEESYSAIGLFASTPSRVAKN